MSAAGESLDPPDWEKRKPELIRLARNRGTRNTAWSPSIPCDWAPQSVWDPRFDMFFTDEGAWNYIVDLLESGHVFTEVKMHKPPDTIAYETCAHLSTNGGEIYIKVQVLRGRIFGRSFHNSTKTR